MSRLSPPLVLAAALAAGLPAAQGAAQTAPAPSAPLAPGQCFSTSDIVRTVRVNPRQVNVRARGDRYYRIDLNGPCGFSLNDPVVLRPFGNGQICGASNLDVGVLLGGRDEAVCLVRDLRALSPEEVAALPPREKP